LTINLTGFGLFVRCMEMVHEACTRNLQGDVKEVAGFMSSLPSLFGMAFWIVGRQLQVTNRIFFKLVDVENSQCVKRTYNNKDCACVLAKVLEQALMVNPRPRNELGDNMAHLSPDLESRPYSLKPCAECERHAEEEKGAEEAPMEER